MKTLSQSNNYLKVLHKKKKKIIVKYNHLYFNIF